MKKEIGIVFWGKDSAEKEISLKSAKNIYKNINKELFNPYLLKLYDLSEIQVVVDEKSIKLNITDYSFVYNGNNIKIDVCVVMIHGVPAESGELQEYFKKINMPYVSSNSLVMKNTFDKYKANKILSQKEICVPKSFIISSNFDFTKLNLPFIIKPTKSGSSFGVCKVNNLLEVDSAIASASKFSKELMVEEFISGREFACGCYKDNFGYHILPVTEIIFDAEIFDYKAKYCGKSEEITPANIPNELTSRIQEQTSKIGEILNIEAFFRVDYIYNASNLYQIEVNTIPGMSNESIFPKMLESNNVNLADILTTLITEKL